MNEMILNHASLTASNRYEAVDWLKDLAVGISKILLCKRTQLILRTQYAFENISCLPDLSFAGLVQELRIRGFREEYLLFRRAETKAPLLFEIESNIKARFRGCDVRGLTTEEGAPLLLCALTDNDPVAIGFPSQPAWDRDQITVEFDELSPHGDIEESSETIDHLSRAEHAHPICQRHLDQLRRIGDPTTVWDRKDEIFPHLTFGPGIEHNLAELQLNVLGIVIRRLGELDDAVARWRNNPDHKHDPIPPCACKITPESESVMQNPKRREERRFASSRGGHELFEWHARFGSSGRIHLCIDLARKEMEIGYIGRHLPL